MSSSLPPGALPWSVSDHHRMALNAQTAVARVLLGQEGIDWCRTALHEAAGYAENSDCFAILLAGHDLTTVNTKDLWGVTLLWLTVDERAASCVQMLISDSHTGQSVTLTPESKISS